jgi:peroxiredoxin
MSHITKTYEEVLSRGTFDEDEGTFTFDNIVLKDALLDFYTKAFCRGLEEFRENLERLEKERANETV